MNDDFSTALRQTAELMDRELSEFLPESDNPEKQLHSAMRYAALSGGKRLRAFLVIQSADLFNVSRDYSVRVAAALEIMHTYSLVHDDLPCMDDDDLRRGVPTVHKKFDETIAVLAGDALQAMAFEILADPLTHPSGDVRASLVRKLAMAAGGHGMVGGQTMDIYTEQDDLSVATITRLQQMKTGALITFACEAGAILGHADPAKRTALRAYAHDLGLAFQITDDILDVEGTSEEMGKATRKDVDAGKATFVSLLGLEKAKIHADMLSEQAISHLDVFNSKADLLRDAAEFTVKRNK
ncbi:polyprenyl synthetase family protein [Sneathiella sp. P13V-1]|uniref:polyprenyl synthetase family protein n=1 Tax=Sneathiella sp. P13V-1 TaxID=2697366 RepID=UPI00187BA6F6|nr:farnesyl diphosphate synthase [Sneathiella sp. P13V-1]MBE7637936.1 polyprenyl synthetase family protein [Sneathiella sp. P13V-1]